MHAVYHAFSLFSVNADIACLPLSRDGSLRAEISRCKRNEINEYSNENKYFAHLLWNVRKYLIAEYIMKLAL